MVSYDFVMPSSFNAYVQTLKDLLHEIRKVIHKTSQRLGGWKQKEIKLTMQKFYLAKWVQVRVSTKGTVNFNCCQFWSDLSHMRSPKPPHLSICLSVCTCQKGLVGFLGSHSISTEGLWDPNGTYSFKSLSEIIKSNHLEILLDRDHTILFLSYFKAMSITH